MRLLDSNAVIFHLAGRIDVSIARPDSLVSIVTGIEVLSFPGLGEAGQATARLFFQSVRAVNIDEHIKATTIQLRKQHKLKLPDAIICATAMCLGAELVTSDERLWSVAGLRCIRFSVK